MLLRVDTGKSMVGTKAPMGDKKPRTLVPVAAQEGPPFVFQNMSPTHERWLSACAPWPKIRESRAQLLLAGHREPREEVVAEVVNMGCP